MKYKGYFLGLATVLIGAVAGANYFPKVVSNIEIIDHDQNGTIDYIVDKNWKILLTNNLNNYPQVDKDYRVCIFSTEIPTKNIGTEFSEKVRPLLEYCLYQNSKNYHPGFRSRIE